MFDAFPFNEWSDKIADFWTFGGAESTGTWIMTALGFAVCMISFVLFIRLENRKLDHQAEVLRATGALDRPPDAPAATE
ncbi:MAG: hypothetical protein FJW96_14720 [Actinobacteria bacterium]|nr:hypothetical protein [Actinomycetota bacterium]